MDNVSDVVKAAIQTQIIAAFNQAPELVEKLVKAALAKPVDSISGSEQGYHGSRVPYIDYLVGDEIRTATRKAVQTVVAEHAATIEACVREGLNAQSVTEAISKAVIGAATQGWGVTVKFEAEKDRR